MGKIVAINLNTSIDNIQMVSEFNLNSVIRSKESFVYPSGKGINSARVIDALQKPVLVIGFVGKDYFNFFNSIKTKFIDTLFFKVNSPSRINTTLLTTSNTFLAHIQGVGFTLNASHLNRLLNKIDDILNSDDVVIISGSLPRGMPINTYAKIVNVCKKKSKTVIFDTSQPALKFGIQSKPNFIKPNLEELSELIGKPLLNEMDIVSAAKELNEEGVENVIVSLGAEGLIFTSIKEKNTYYRVRLPVNIEETSGDEIGCGDSLIGGLAVGIHEGLNIIECLTLAISCGVANLYEVGPGTCNINDIMRLKSKVEMEIKTISNTHY